MLRCSMYDVNSSAVARHFGDRLRPWLRDQGGRFGSSSHRSTPSQSLVIRPDISPCALADRRYNLRRSDYRGMDILPGMGIVQGGDARGLIGRLNWRPV